MHIYFYLYTYVSLLCSFFVLVSLVHLMHAERTSPSVMDIIKYPLTVWVSKEPRYMQHLGNCFLNHYISFNLVDIPKPTITPIAPIADLANIPVEEEESHRKRQK